MKKLPKFLIPVLVLITAIVGIGFLLQKKVQPVTPGTFEWKIVRNTQSVSPPDYELYVYLSGEKISDVQAIELDADLEGSNLELANAETGDFYANPLTIKMDTVNMVFAVARNPANQTSIDSTQPLFKFRFRAQTGFNEAVFRILPESQIYIKNVGGAYPIPSQFILQK